MTSQAGAAPRVRRTWDIVLAITLLVVLVVLAVVLGFAGAFLVMASDSCGIGNACRESQLSAGVLIAMIGPGVVAVVAIVSVVERLVRARFAFWPPIVGIVVALGIWACGAGLVFSSVPST